MDGVEYLSFSSAGTRGFVYFGVIDAIEHYMGVEAYEAWRERLKGACGTSAGAMAALAIVLGLTKEQRRLAFTQLSDHRNIVNPDVALLANSYGLGNGCELKRVFQRMLTLVGLSSECTLRDLRRFVPIDFIVCATNLNESAPFMLSACTAPDMTVVDAVFSSCCVPFVFTPFVLSDGTMLSDGCLTCDYPNQFDQKKTLFFRLNTTPPSKIEWWPDFMTALVRCASQTQEHLWRRIVDDGCPHVVVNVAGVVNTFDIHQDEGAIDKLYRCGYAATMNHLLNGSPYKLATDCSCAYARWLIDHGPHESLQQCVEETPSEC